MLHTVEQKTAIDNNRSSNQINKKEKEAFFLMGSTKMESYFVFMNYDPEYGRLRADRTERGTHELDLYLDRKHDELLASALEPGTYKKTSSLVIVDAFAVEITEDQANVLRSAKGVRVVEKNEVPV
ncbi:Subtilisin-like protease SBT2.5 [Glycine soja]